MDRTICAQPIRGGFRGIPVRRRQPRRQTVQRPAHLEKSNQPVRIDGGDHLAFTPTVDDQPLALEQHQGTADRLTADAEPFRHFFLADGRAGRKLAGQDRLPNGVKCLFRQI